MQECECLPKCPFFNDKMKSKPATANLMKRKYCKGGDYSSCARFMIFRALGRDAVPSDLFPNQREKAAEILQLQSETL